MFRPLIEVSGIVNFEGFSSQILYLDLPFSTYILFLLLGEESRNVIGKGLPLCGFFGFFGFFGFLGLLRSLIFLVKQFVLGLSIGFL